MSTITGLLSVWWNVINGFLCRLRALGFQLTRKVIPWLDWQEVLTNQSQYPTNIPSILKPLSNDITSASVQLCDTDICFLHAHDIFTNA